MTENEAIEELKQNIEMPFGSDVSDNASRLAITALEEIQMYHKIGSLEEIEEILQIISAGQDDVDERGISTGLLHTLLEYAKYAKIGMVQECQEAVERQRAKKPNIWGDGVGDDGETICDMYDCPNCGKSYEIDYEEYKYCPNCGQAIDWSDLSAKLAVENVGGWTACEDRLPEDGIDVLVWYEYFRYGAYNRAFQTTGISFTHNGKWSGFVNGASGWEKLRILAWQPLPTPYKSKECKKQ